jgi:hypothetical protein
MEKGLSVVVYVLINSLFLLKYLPRTPLNPLPGTSLYLLLTVGLIALLLRFLNQPPSTHQRSFKRQYYLLGIVVLAGIILLQQAIDPMQLQVDRWSAIDHFLQRLLAGEYPYMAQTHLGGYGSPFPFWNFFHLPFFVVGDVAFGMIALVSVLIISLKAITGSYRRALVYLILLALSPAFWYEVAVRSDLIYNFILCFLICGWWYRKGITVENAPLLTGVISGLMLSTRLSIIIPFFIFLFPVFVSTGWKQRIRFTVVAALTYVLTFLPFVVWDVNSLVFFEYNPFVLQTRQGSLIEIAILLVLVIFFALSWKAKLERFSLYTALTILIFIAATFLHRMISDQFVSGLFSSRYDITYFTMALPFVLATIAGIETDGESVSA